MRPDYGTNQGLYEIKFEQQKAKNRNLSKEKKIYFIVNKSITLPDILSEL